MVQAIDAETGKTLWVRQIGRREYPSLTPAANHNFLVVVNGSRMYVVNRQNGNLLAERVLDGAPSVAVAVSAIAPLRAHRRRRDHRCTASTT